MGLPLTKPATATSFTPSRSPGDQVILEAEAIATKARTGSLKCRAFVGDKGAAEAQIRFMMVDAEQD